MPNQIHLSFLDPPFNQGKFYRVSNDNLETESYWIWMTEILSLLYKATAQGGAVYFMQREKNTERVLRALRESGWNFRNLIIWKKKTSAVPMRGRYGLQYQIIAYGIKGERARVFHRLRIAPPLPAHYKFPRADGVYLTDVWDDIRELTAGYFAGDEALRDDSGLRFHKQQSPLALLVRIILSSSSVGDVVFDPFAGTGTALIAASQLQRIALGVEIDGENVSMIESRLQQIRPYDSISRFYKAYVHTENLAHLWGLEEEREQQERNSAIRHGEEALLI